MEWKNQYLNCKDIDNNNDNEYNRSNISINNE